MPAMAGGELPERLASVRAAMARAAERARRDPASVRLIAVSKTIPIAGVQRALEAGVTDLGENRVQEAQQKIPALAAWPARWHLIGHLQSNKVGKALQLFAVIHSIDTVELATLVSRRRLARQPEPVAVLFEVNIVGEASKQGFTPEGLIAAAPTLAALPGLRPEGLMTVAPAVADPEDARPAFRQLRELRTRLTDVFGGEFRELSMGMSHDYGVAIEEGATMVRIGTAIFGART
jgi:PLP dependent protein